MTEQNAKRLLGLTAESYKKISQPFSDTRNRVWTDCKAFEGIVKKRMRILDAGCGNGKLVPWLAEQGIASYTGIDLNPNFIRIAQERYENERYRFFEGDVLALQEHPVLQEATFDAALCIAVLHHLPSENMRIAALRNLKERISEGGVLCMTSWNFFQIPGASKNVWKHLAKRCREKSLYRDYPGLSWRDLLTHWKGGGLDEILYYHAFTARELTRLCQQAGFKKIHSWYSSNAERRHWWDGRNILTIAYA